MNDKRDHYLKIAGKRKSSEFDIADKEAKSAEQLMEELDKLKSRAQSLKMDDIVINIDIAIEEFNSKKVSKETVKSLRKVKTDSEFEIQLKEIKIQNNSKNQNTK